MGCRWLFLTEETQQWFITSTVQEIMCPMCHRSVLVNVFPTQKKTQSVEHTLTCLDAFADQFNSLLACQSPGGAVLWWEAVGAGGWCRISSNLKTEDIKTEVLFFCVSSLLLHRSLSQTTFQHNRKRMSVNNNWMMVEMLQFQGAGSFLWLSVNLLIHPCRWSLTDWWSEAALCLSLSSVPSRLSACWLCCTVFWGRSSSSRAGLCWRRKLGSASPCPRWTWSQRWTGSRTLLCQQDRWADSGRRRERSWRWRSPRLQVETPPLFGASAFSVGSEVHLQPFYLLWLSSPGLHHLRYSSFFHLLPSSLASLLDHHTPLTGFHPECYE